MLATAVIRRAIIDGDSRKFLESEWGEFWLDLSKTSIPDWAELIKIEDERLKKRRAKERENYRKRVLTIND